MMNLQKLLYSLALSLFVLPSQAAERPQFPIETEKFYDPATVPAYAGDHADIYAHIDRSVGAHTAALQRWMRQRSISAQNDGDAAEPSGPGAPLLDATCFNASFRFSFEATSSIVIAGVSLLFVFLDLRTARFADTDPSLSTRPSAPPGLSTVSGNRPS